MVISLLNLLFTFQSISTNAADEFRAVVQNYSG